MNVVEMHQWFDLIQDKVDSVYYTETEKDQFINRSIQLFINDIIHKFTDTREGPLVISSNLEESLNASEVLRPLMLLDLPVSTDEDGVITEEEIDSAIETATGETETFLHILSVSDGTKHIAYVRENDFYKFNQNEFKKATEAYKQYRVGELGVYVHPLVDDNGQDLNPAGYFISVIKAPKQVNYETLDSTDLPETTHDYILAKALELAGLASQDEALLQMRNAV